MAGSRTPSEGGERKADFSWGRGRNLPSLRVSQHGTGQLAGQRAPSPWEVLKQLLNGLGMLLRGLLWWVGGLDCNQGFLCSSWKPFLQMAACEKPSK